MQEEYNLDYIVSIIVNELDKAIDDADTIIIHDTCTGSITHNNYKPIQNPVKIMIPISDEIVIKYLRQEYTKSNTYKAKVTKEYVYPKYAWGTTATISHHETNGAMYITLNGWLNNPIAYGNMSIAKYLLGEGVNLYKRVFNIQGRSPHRLLWKIVKRYKEDSVALVHVANKLKVLIDKAIVKEDIYSSGRSNGNEWYMYMLYDINIDRYKLNMLSTMLTCMYRDKGWNTVLLAPIGDDAVAVTLSRRV